MLSVFILRTVFRFMLSLNPDSHVIILMLLFLIWSLIHLKITVSDSFFFHIYFSYHAFRCLQMIFKNTEMLEEHKGKKKRGLCQNPLTWLFTSHVIKEHGKESEIFLFLFSIIFLMAKFIKFIQYTLIYLYYIIWIYPLISI